MSSCIGFLYTFCVYGRIRVHVQWTGTVAPVGPWPVWPSYDGRVIEASADTQWKRGPQKAVGRQGEYVVVSQQFAGIKNFVSQFGR